MKDTLVRQDLHGNFVSFAHVSMSLTWLRDFRDCTSIISSQDSGEDA